MQPNANMQPYPGEFDDEHFEPPKNPHLQIVVNTDTIASCNMCGQENYTRGRTGDGKRQTATFTPRPGVRLWDLRICPNGTPTTRTVLCRVCLIAIRDKIEDDVLEEDA